ncbi:unnamed protein product, partial [Ixodes pacificus]
RHGDGGLPQHHPVVWDGGALLQLLLSTRGRKHGALQRVRLLPQGQQGPGRCSGLCSRVCHAPNGSLHCHERPQRRRLGSQLFIVHSHDSDVPVFGAVRLLATIGGFRACSGVHGTATRG